MYGNVLASLGNALLLGKLRQPASHDNVVTNCYLSYSLPVYTQPLKDLTVLPELSDSLLFTFTFPYAFTHDKHSSFNVSECRAVVLRIRKGTSGGSNRGWLLRSMYYALYTIFVMSMSLLLIIATPPHTADHHNRYARCHLIVLRCIKCSMLNCFFSLSSYLTEKQVVTRSHQGYYVQRGNVVRFWGLHYRHICRGVPQSILLAYILLEKPVRAKETVSSDSACNSYGTLSLQ